MATGGRRLGERDAPSVLARMRAGLALAWPRRAYRGRVVDDRPRSRAYFALRYGSWAKLVNYLRVKGDWRAMRTTLRGYPYAVRVEPVSACNLRCPLCPTGAGEISRAPAAMTPETLDAVLERCGRYALYAHLWIWGEPLLNKHLAELVAVCRRHGVGSEVSTHLSLPLSESRIDALILSGLDWLIVSNDAASAGTYAQYRIGGDFDQVLRNLRAIVARKRALGSRTPFVEWQFVPFRHNEHEMAAVARLAREIGVDGVRFKPARLDKTRGWSFEGSVPADFARQWAPSDPKLVHVVSAQRHAYLDFHCPSLWGTASVYADGSMAPCCETTSPRDDVGNLFECDFPAIWNGPAYVRARRAALGLPGAPGEQPPACQGCKVFVKPLAQRVRAKATRDADPAVAAGPRTEAGR